MRVQTVPLSNFVEVNPEGVTKSYQYDEILYIDISSVGSGCLLESPKLISRNEAPSRAKRIVRDGDTILATVRPNLRAFLLVKNPEENTVASTGFAVLRAKANADSRYIYYAITDNRFTGYLTNNTKGTSYPAVDTDIVIRGEIPAFDLPLQKKIADTLSTYDNLIENNQRRMVLLEGAARQLYYEWFVRLRFPSYEHTHITNGVPEGWERMTLGERVTLNYGKALKADERTEGQYPVYGSSGIIGTHEKPLVTAPGIVIGRKGNVGSVYWCAKDYWPIDTVYFISSEMSTLWLYYALQHMHFISTDVAVPGLNRDFAYSRLLLVPQLRILREFLEVVEPLHHQLTKLNEMNEKLRAARDLLLPRLMNGEIAV